MDGEAWLCCSPWGCEESDTTEQLPFHFSLSCIGEGNGNPLQCSCLENPRDEGAWWAAVYGVAQSRTRLKRLSSSSIRIMVAHWVRKYSLCFYLLKEIVENSYNFFLCIRYWTYLGLVFMFWKVIDYWLNFILRYTHILNYSCMSFGILFLLKNQFISSRLSNLCAWSCS